MMREVVLDTETTGLNPKTGDRVVEIGCVALVNHMPSGENYHQHINPQRDMPAEAFAVHALSEEFLADKPLFADIAPALIDFIADANLIIHNAAFDIGFLNHELKLCGRPPLAADRVTDTLELARARHPFGPNSLDALCRRYGIDTSSRTVHGALVDCELLAEVYLELIGGRQPGLGLDPGGEQMAASAAPQPARARPAPLGSRLSQDEIAAHSAFVKTLGPQALWRTHQVGAGDDDPGE